MSEYFSLCPSEVQCQSLPLFFARGYENCTPLSDSPSSSSSQMHHRRAGYEAFSSIDAQPDFEALSLCPTFEYEHTQTAIVFLRRKAGEKERGTDQPVRLTIQMLEPYFDTSLKKTSGILVRLFPGPGRRALVFESRGIFVARAGWCALECCGGFTVTHRDIADSRP